jgi:fatty acid desaturase
MNPPTDRVLAPDALRALQTRSNARGALRLTLHLTALIAAGYWVATATPWTILPAILALGLVQAALFAPHHETMHQTAFASRRANAIVGWLASAPSLLNAQFYAAFHLAHHRHTQIPGQDPELLTPTPATPRDYLLRILGIPFWRARALLILRAWRNDLSEYNFIPPTAAKPIIRSVRAQSAMMLAAALLAAFLINWKTPFLYWILPQLLGTPFLVAYLLAEHTGCTQDRNGLTNTRTTLTNALVRALMWNMPFHAEHHLYPSIPFHRLPAAHRAIRARLGVIEPGYLGWNRAFLRALARPGRPPQAT